MATFQSFNNVWTGPGGLTTISRYGFFLQGRDHPGISGQDVEGIAPGSVIYQVGTPVGAQLYPLRNEAMPFSTYYQGYAQANLNQAYPFVTTNNSPDLHYDYDLFRLGTSAGTYQLAITKPRIYENFFGYNDGVLTDPAISGGGYNGGPLNPEIWIHYEERTGNSPVLQRWASGSFNSTIDIRSMTSDRLHGNYINAVIRDQIGTNFTQIIKGVYLLLDNDTDAFTTYSFLKTAPSVIRGEFYDQHINNAGAHDAYFHGLVGQYNIYAVNSDSEAQRIVSEGASDPAATWASVESDQGLIPTAADVNRIRQITGWPADTTGTPTNGNDNLFGLSSNDTVNLQGGNDTYTGGGGNDTIDGGTGTDTAVYSGVRIDYEVTKTSTGYQVRDLRANRDGTDSIANVELLRFSNMSNDLTMLTEAAKISDPALKILLELYVGFFNRVPEASGIKYWINELVASGDFTAIANRFYDAGVQFSDLTGYSSTMTNEAFVRTLYANVLGRSGSNAPSDSDVSFWSKKIVSGELSRGAVALQMISDTHEFFTNHPQFGYVASLLDNKAVTAYVFGVGLGISYNSDAENITRGMQIAAAVTPTSTEAAIALIGITDTPQ
ncbi:Domain of unknown function DUF4214 [Rhabdaerophilaceae bacterium]